MNLKERITPKNVIMAMATILGVAGAYLNALGNILCFPIWLISNSVFAVAAFKDKNNWNVSIFCLYFSTSLLGLITW